MGKTNFLKQKFEEKNISKTDISKRTGIDRSTISYYINGRKKINKIDHLYLIAEVLELNFLEFNKLLEEVLK